MTRRARALPQRWRVRVVMACLLAVPLLSHAGDDDVDLLHPLFQERAVLQRDQPIPVWGRARPGAAVEVAFAGASLRVRADADGRWRARLPAQPAGGPHVLTVTSAGVVRRADDVLIGDVWLCSGQSNMELPVWRTLDARAEIAGADDPRIRVLTVPQAASATPRETFPVQVQWRSVSPDTVRDTSAACYYFARELRKTIDVPMGLVVAAWGGSRIQAWANADAIRAVGGHDDELDILALHARDATAAAARWGERWATWWAARDGALANDQPWRSDHVADAAHGWRDAPRQLGAWERWGVPELAEYDGMVWYRTTVELTSAQVAQPATLVLGPADEMDVSWVNGVAVGSTYGAGDARTYALPQGLLVEGVNAVAVNVLDTWREGGLAGPAEAHAIRFGDGTQAMLGPQWRYRIAAGEASPPRAPWQSAAGLTTLHNGMIAPLGAYALRGALWYQGESNTFEAGRYGSLLRALRDDWRARFRDDLPLLIVQLAGFGMPDVAPVASDWAELREVQRRVAADDPGSALVVAIDIGDRYDIHPPNKQELGRRLARAARHAVYGEHVPASGPVPRSATREGDAVVVRFGDIAGELSVLGGDAVLGFELCAEAEGSCRFAHATLRGQEVLLRAPVAGASRVRYGWASHPILNLRDDAGLPPGPFEHTIQ